MSGASHGDGGNGGGGDQHGSPPSSSDAAGRGPLHESSRSISASSFSYAPRPSSPRRQPPPPSPGSPSRRNYFLTKSSLRESLRRLDSSSRLSVTCSGSDLGQLYLSSPEQDALQILSPYEGDDERGGMRRNSSWLQAADLYGRRRSFKRMGSYANFLELDVMSEESDEEEEEQMLLIEEADGPAGEYKMDGRLSARRCMRRLKLPVVVVPIMMVVDLVLGVSLSLYDSHLLRNVPGFRFPLCYALVQKLTNALASLVLICLTRRWDRLKHRKISSAAANSDVPLAELPSIHTFRQHAVPLSAVALVQTISAACANKALQIIPLPLFKVCLMCGPIFVALIASMAEGKLYSKGRLLALSLIGIGACRAVYAEAEGADNPRSIMEGAGFALGASAFGGIGLCLSSVLMNRGGSDDDDESSGQRNEKTDSAPVEVELNPLSLLFYLSCEQVLMLGVYLCPWWELEENDGGLEGAGELAAFASYFAEKPSTAAFYLMTGSTMSLLLAVLTFVLVNRTSPVATSLLGNVRSIATVGISSVVFGNAGGGLFGSVAFGYSLTLAGGAAYALAALRNDGPP